MEVSQSLSQLLDLKQTQLRPQVISLANRTRHYCSLHLRVCMLKKIEPDHTLTIIAEILISVASGYRLYDNQNFQY